MIAAAFAILGLLVLVWWFWIWGKRPVDHEIPCDRIQEFIETLYDRGHNGAVLTLKPDLSQVEFIQFSKYIDADGRSGIQFDFPRAPWSESTYYQRLRDLLLGSRFDFSTETVGKADVKAFLVVDLHRNLSDAAELAALCMEHLFGRTPDDVVWAQFQDVSVR